MNSLTPDNGNTWKELFSTLLKSSERCPSHLVKSGIAHENQAFHVNITPHFKVANTTHYNPRKEDKFHPTYTKTSSYTVLAKHVVGSRGIKINLQVLKI